MPTTSWIVLRAEILRPFGYVEFKTTSNINGANTSVDSTELSDRFDNDDRFNNWWATLVQDTDGSTPANGHGLTRIVEVPQTEINLLSFQATNPGAGTFDRADVRYIRLTNKDDTNHITLVFRSASSTECAHKLDAGQSFIYAGTAAGIVVTHLASGSPDIGSSPTLVDLVAITAFANSAACDLELFVAGD